MEKKGVATCVVCRETSDQVTLHYSRLLCNGCRAFFKRTVQGKVKFSRCKLRGACQVSVITRKNCKACRYEACVNAGVDKHKVQPQRRDFTSGSPERPKKGMRSLAPRNVVIANRNSHLQHHHPHHPPHPPFLLDNFSMPALASRDGVYQSNSLRQASSMDTARQMAPPPPSMFTAFPGNLTQQHFPAQTGGLSLFHPSTDAAYVPPGIHTDAYVPPVIHPDPFAPPAIHPDTPNGVSYQSFLPNPPSATNQFLHPALAAGHHAAPMGAQHPGHVNASPFFQGQTPNYDPSINDGGQFQVCTFSSQLSYGQIFHQRGSQSVFTPPAVLLPDPAKRPPILPLPLSHSIDRFISPFDGNPNAVPQTSTRFSASGEQHHHHQEEEQTSSGSQKSDKSAAFMISSLLDFDSITTDSESKSSKTLLASEQSWVPSTDSSTPNTKSHHGYSTFSISALTEDISGKCEKQSCHDDSGLPRDHLTSTPNPTQALKLESAEINVAECNTPSPINHTESDTQFDSGVNPGLLHDSNNDPISDQRLDTSCSSSSSSDTENEVERGTEHITDDQQRSYVTKLRTAVQVHRGSVVAFHDTTNKPDGPDGEKSKSENVFSSSSLPRGLRTVEDDSGFENITNDSSNNSSFYPQSVNRLQFIDKHQRFSSNGSLSSKTDAVGSGLSRSPEVTASDSANHIKITPSIPEKLLDSSQNQTHTVSTHLIADETSIKQEMCDISRTLSEETDERMKEISGFTRLSSEAIINGFPHDALNSSSLSSTPTKHKRSVNDENDPPQTTFSGSPAKNRPDHVAQHQPGDTDTNLTPRKSTPRKKRCLVKLEVHDLSADNINNSDQITPQFCDKSEALNNMHQEKDPGEMMRHDQGSDDVIETIETTSAPSRSKPPNKMSKRAILSSTEGKTNVPYSLAHSLTLERHNLSFDEGEQNSKGDNSNIEFQTESEDKTLKQDDSVVCPASTDDVFFASAPRGQESESLSQNSCAQSKELSTLSCLDLIIENIRKARTEQEVAEARKELEIFYKT